MRIVVEVQRIRLGHEPVEGAFESRSPLNVGDARGRGRLLFVEFRPFPNRKLLVRFQREQDFAVLRIVRVGEQNQHRLLLVDARQPKHITRLLERQRAVRTRGVDVIREEHRDGTRFHSGHEVGAVALIEVGRKGLVSHEAKIPNSPRRAIQVSAASIRQQVRHRDQSVARIRRWCSGCGRFRIVAAPVIGIACDEVIPGWQGDQ